MKQDEIAALLPAVFQSTLADPRPPALRRTAAAPPNPLAKFLDVMTGLHARDEHILDELDTYFSPDLTRNRFLPYLSHWLDLDWLLDENYPPPEVDLPEDDGPGSIEPHRLRRLMLAAVALYRQRGTQAGLVGFLEVATGATGFRIRMDPKLPFHMHVECPDGVDKNLVRRIVTFEKPAFTTFDLCAPASPGEGGR